MNGESERGEKFHDSSAISIDTKDLSSRKVIQVKIDNPFLSNDDSDEEELDSNPFCIKVSKGSDEIQTEVPLTNGDRSSSNHGEGGNSDHGDGENHGDGGNSNHADVGNSNHGDGGNSKHGDPDAEQKSSLYKEEGDKATTEESEKGVECPSGENSRSMPLSDISNDNVNENMKENCGADEEENNAQNDECNLEDSKTREETTDVIADEKESKMKDETEDVKADDKDSKMRAETDVMADDDNSQCSSVSAKSSVKSENNFGDVEDENSRSSMKLSEKLDNEQAPELSKVIESENATCEDKVDIYKTGDDRKADDDTGSENKETTEEQEMPVLEKEVNSKIDPDVDNIPAGASDEKESVTSGDQKDEEMTEKSENENEDGEIGDEKMEVDKDENNSAVKDPGESEGTKEEEDAEMEDARTSEVTKSSEPREPGEKKDIEEQDKDKSSTDEVGKMETDAEKDYSKEKTDKVVPSSDDTLPKSVEKVQDDDGTDILITVNEDHSDEEMGDEKAESSKPAVPKVTEVKSPEKTEKPKVKSTFENDVVIVDLSAESPKDDKGKPSWSNTGIPSVVPKTNTPTVAIPKVVPSVNGTVIINGQQYIQQILYDTNGRKQIVQVPINNANKHLYSTMLSQAALAVKTPQLQNVAVKAPQPPPAKPKTGLARFKDIDDDIPIASWEQLDLVKYEWNTKKYDNTFWAGVCPANKNSELSAPTKFLMDLGSDLVKKSAYTQILKVQGRKEQDGKLGKGEKENLKKMRDIVDDLKEKLKDFDLENHSCDGCNFTTESENVLQFHKEHPHMDPPLDPHGDMLCSIAECDLRTSSTSDFAYHMDKTHKMKARVYDKPEPHKCSLCYYEAKNKHMLTKHRFRCVKQFKASLNQVPHYTDVNYCLKNLFYKYQAKKVAPIKPKPAAVKPQPTLVRPLAQPTILQHGKVPLSSGMIQLTGNRPVVVSAGNIQYGPVFTTLGNLPNQSLQLIGVTGTQAVTGTTAAKPTVNELLKQKVAQNPGVKTGPSIVDLTPQATKSAFEVCEICGGYVKDKMSLRIHFFYAHKIDLPASLFNRGLPPLFCEVCKKGYWTSQGLTKHKYSLKHFSTANQNQNPSSVKNIVAKPTPQCWICNQKPANLYSHLFKFHHLSTSQCMAQRRCMFCGIQSNTVREMEIHMAATHGVLVKGDDKNAKVKSKPPPSGLVRNNFCVFCSRQFVDNTQLTLHCLRDHATCSHCGMVVANVGQLQTHVCKNSASKKCEICGIKNLKAQYYTKHVMTHLKKCRVKLKRVTDKQIEDAMGKERKAEMDLAKQKELFTKLEADIWNEIETRRKRDKEEDELNKDPVARKRKSEEHEEEKIQKKIQKLEDEDPDYAPSKDKKDEDEEVVVVDD